MDGPEKAVSSPMREPQQPTEEASQRYVKSALDVAPVPVSLLLRVFADVSVGRHFPDPRMRWSSRFRYTLAAHRYSEDAVTCIPALRPTFASFCAASSVSASTRAAGTHQFSDVLSAQRAASSPSAVAAALFSQKHVSFLLVPSLAWAAATAARAAVCLPIAAAAPLRGGAASTARLPPMPFSSCVGVLAPNTTTGKATTAARPIAARGCMGRRCFSRALQPHQRPTLQERLPWQSPKAITTDTRTDRSNPVALSEAQKQHHMTPRQLQRTWPLPQRQRLTIFRQQQQQLYQQQPLLQHWLSEKQVIEQQLFHGKLQRHHVYQQESRRPFSSGFPNTKRRITNPFWRRTGWWDWRRREVGKLNKARARRRHLWPRASLWSSPRAAWDQAAAAGVPPARTVPEAAVAAARAAAAARDSSARNAGDPAVVAARAAAAVEAAAAAVARCMQKRPPAQDDDNSNSRRRVVLPVEGARQRPFWRGNRQKLLKQYREAVGAAEAAARSAATEEEREGEGTEELGLTEQDDGAAVLPDRRRQRSRANRLRLTHQDLMGVKKGRGRVWEERKDGIPLGKKRLLLYCRLIKGAQITDAIDWLSALCIHRVNYLLNLLLKTRQKIHEEGGDVSRVYIESYMLNIQGRVKRLQFRLRMVNFIKTWKFAVLIRCRELPLDEFFHRLFILKKVPRSLTTDMRLAVVEKKVPPTVIREWYPYLDASTRFWHRHRLRWLDRTRQFDYYLARKAFKATYEENCRRRRVQLLEARGAPALLVENEKHS